MDRLVFEYIISLKGVAVLFFFTTVKNFKLSSASLPAPERAGRLHVASLVVHERHERSAGGGMQVGGLGQRIFF